MPHKQALSALLLICCLALSGVAQQAAPVATTTRSSVVPMLSRFSGTLKDINGKPLNEITGVTFALYTDADGGAPVWLETQNVRPDLAGHYSVALGATAKEGLPADLFASGEARWLGVQISGQAENPRVLLLSVPYALKAQDAETIGGLPVSAFMLANAPVDSIGRVQAVNVNAPSIPAPAASSPVTGTGILNFVPLWDTSSDIISSVLSQSGTGATAKVGINNATPASTLDVNGGATVRGALSLVPSGTATASAGNNSQPLSLAASSFNSSTAKPLNETFEWQAEPAGNNTSSASGTLNLLFSSGGTPTETGLRVASNGQITFAPGQPFPGVGTITGVTAGPGLTGGGPAGNVSLGLTACPTGQVLESSGTSWTCASIPAGGGTVAQVNTGVGLTGGPITNTGTLSVDRTVVPLLSAANVFTQNQAINGWLGIGTISPAAVVDIEGSKTAPGQSAATALIVNGGAGGDSSGSLPDVVGNGGGIGLTGGTGGQGTNSNGGSGGGVTLTGGNGGQGVNLGGTGGDITLVGGIGGTNSVARFPGGSGAKVTIGGGKEGIPFYNGGNGGSITLQPGTTYGGYDGNVVVAGDLNVTPGNVAVSGNLDVAGAITGNFSGTFVGVGTNSPSAQMDIEGTTPSSPGASAATALVVNGGSGSAGAISAGNGGNGAGVAINAGNGGPAGASGYRAGNGGGVVIKAGNGGPAGVSGGITGNGGSIVLAPGTASPGGNNGSVQFWSYAQAAFYRDTGTNGTGIVGPSRNGDLSLVSRSTTSWLRLGSNQGAIAFWTDGHAEDNETAQMFMSTNSLYAFGTCLAGSCLSDARLKKNIKPFAPMLDNLARLQPVTWEWRTDEFPDLHLNQGRSSGLIAQEVEKSLPNLVSTDEHGFKAIDYSQLPMLLLEAVRELKAENDDLRAKLRDQETVAEAQRDQIARLASQMRAVEDVLQASGRPGPQPRTVAKRD